MKRKLVSVLLVGVMAMSLVACGATTDATKEKIVESDTQQEQISEVEETMVRTTEYGSIQGVDNGDYQVWYGVPYAAAPVGELRWAEPIAPETWTETLDCTEGGETFIQCGTDSTTGKSYVTGSEDCLKLDVYSTAKAENLPVLVYIHGGNNQTGSSAEIPGAQIVADENCVYVSLNYRLGILGFNCLPSLQTEDGDTGNYALLDIAMALDWVRNNIVNFGGDPENITISGFSAGGRDVMAMLTSPIFEGKFDKAIVFSGGMTMADEDASASQIAWAVAPLAVEDGMAEDEEMAHDWLLTSGNDVKEYLYSVDADRLVALMSNAGIRMSVFPHLYKDGVILPEEGFDTTTYYSVPIIMLTGSTEFSFFSAFDGYFGTFEDEKEKNDAIEFVVNYGSEMYRIFNAQCSAEKMYDNYDSDIYVCQIDYGSSKYSQSEIPTLGAFHGIFVPALSDVNGYTSITDFSAEGYTNMANILDDYISNFLMTGDPNGGELSEWTAWTPDSPCSMVLDAGQTEATSEMKDVTISYDEIMAQMDADNTVRDEVKNTIISTIMNGRWFSDALDDKYENENLWK